MSVIYFDTSALAKWYINEAGSDEVERYIQQHGPVSISELTVVEMRCLLARRKRDKSITRMLEGRIYAAFEEDIRRRFLICHPLQVGLTAGAVNLISFFGDIPLRTLDALHLAISKEISTEILVTADHIMAEAAKAMGLKVVLF